MKPNNKRVLSVLLVLAMVISLLPSMIMPAKAAETETVTYSMADCGITETAGAQTAALDDTLTIQVAQGRTGDGLLRIYANQPITFTSAKPISSIVLTASYKTSTFYVETSADNGTTWTRTHSDVPFTSATSDVTVEFETPATYFRLVPAAQMRVKTMVVTYTTGEAGSEPEATETPVATETPTETPTEATEAPTAPTPSAPFESTATITFDDTAKRYVFTTEQQVWFENNVLVTNDKGSSTSNVADYANPARFYKNSTLTVEYPGMTRIDFTCNSATYATNLQNSITAE